MLLFIMFTWWYLNIFSVLFPNTFSPHAIFLFVFTHINNIFIMPFNFLNTSMRIIACNYQQLLCELSRQAILSPFFFWGLSVLSDLTKCGSRTKTQVSLFQVLCSFHYKCGLWMIVKNNRMKKIRKYL